MSKSVPLNGKRVRSRTKVKEEASPKREATPADYRQAFETPACYVNFHLAFQALEGIRIAFGEQFGNSPEDIKTHWAMLISVDQAIRLHATLASMIRQAGQQRQAQIQQQIDQALSQSAVPDAPPA